MYNPPPPYASAPPPEQKSKTPLILGGCGALGCLGLLVLAGFGGYWAYQQAQNNNANRANANAVANTNRNTNRRDNANRNANANDNANDNAAGGETGANGAAGDAAASLPGTSWEGTDSDGDFFRFDFRPGGRLRISQRRRQGEQQTFNGTWRATGNTLVMTGGGYTWTGTVGENEISGSGVDGRGHSWTWSLARSMN